MARMPKIYSPYGPRPRRSARLILIWVAVLLMLFLLTFYLASRENEQTTSYAKMLANKGKGRGKGLAEKAKLVE
ncbi:hypothetical protein F5Y15DRAFT_403394 [Xylariaceae sp. FL0016]|nr:hypothetical protein F5Y15DRAFT_403394 [Xylariaceae sp. FL0016]